LGERPIEVSWCQPLAIVQTIGTWTIVHVPIVVHNTCELAQKMVFNLPKRILKKTIGRKDWRSDIVCLRHNGHNLQNMD
jgi:hypothetical protein